MALGLTQQLPQEDRYIMEKKSAENDIAILMGGRSAEEIIFNMQTTGAGNDIEKATTLARKMVCEWGMSDNLGPLTYGRKEEAIFLGKEFNKRQDYSESTAVEIDEEVKKIVLENYKRAKSMLLANKDVLTILAQTLLEKEVLDGNEIELLIKDKIVKVAPVH
jgi:cell division protease FtsH